MYNDVLNEVGVILEYRNCKRRTTVPVLKVEPGVKCAYYNTDLPFAELAIAYKNADLYSESTKTLRLKKV